MPQTRPGPAPQPTRRPPLRVVTPADTGVGARRRRRLVVGALGSLACTGLFAIVGVRVLLAQGQAPVDALEAEVTAAENLNQRLRLDVARLESPARIVAEAKARLGMVAPAAVVYLPPLTSLPPTPAIPRPVVAAPTVPPPAAGAPADEAAAEESTATEPTADESTGADTAAGSESTAIQPATDPITADPTAAESMSPAESESPASPSPIDASLPTQPAG
jgi:cell division protein FtsB